MDNETVTGDAVDGGIAGGSVDYTETSASGTIDDGAEAESDGGEIAGVATEASPSADADAYDDELLADDEEEIDDGDEVDTEDDPVSDEDDEIEDGEEVSTETGIEEE